MTEKERQTEDSPRAFLEELKTLMDRHPHLKGKIAVAEIPSAPEPVDRVSGIREREIASSALDREDDPESGLEPPSMRILNLLLDTFARWQDAWYFEKSQAEMGHLCQHVAADFGPEKAEEVMALPIMERKGWAYEST